MQLACSAGNACTWRRSSPRLCTSLKGGVQFAVWRMTLSIPQAGIRRAITKKHPEARPTPKEPVPPKSEPPVSPSVPARKRRPKENPAVAYLNRIGGGLSLVSVVSTFQFPSLYWYSVGAFYAGMVALAVGALLERWPLKHRIAVCLGWFIVAAGISAKAVFVKAPIDIFPSANFGNYPDDTDVYGIKWERGLSEMRILISNHSQRLRRCGYLFHARRSYAQGYTG